MDLTRGFEYENHSSESPQNRGTAPIRAPYGSGGFVWNPNSVFQIGSFFLDLILPLARAWSSTLSTRPKERMVASLAVGSRFSGPAGRVYGGEADPSSPLRGFPRKKARRNLSGWRLLLGPSTGLPIGSSSPNRIGWWPAPPRCS